MATLKKSKDIYQGYEFTNIPYDTNEKFSVYIPKDKESIIETISRTHRENMSHSYFHPSQSLPKYLDSTYQQPELVHLPKLSIKNQFNDDNEETVKIKETPSKIDSLNRKIIPRRSKSVEKLSEIRKPLVMSPSPNKDKKKQIIQALQQTKELEAFRAKLYFDDRTHTVPKSTIKSSVIENLIKERDNVLSNKELIHSILKLKTLNLLKNPTLRIEKFRGGKVGFITNDYHLRETNAGYARNTLGTFFTR